MQEEPMINLPNPPPSAQVLQSRGTFWFLFCLGSSCRWLLQGKIPEEKGLFAGWILLSVESSIAEFEHICLSGLKTMTKEMSLKPVNFLLCDHLASPFLASAHSTQICNLALVWALGSGWLTSLLVRSDVEESM